MFHAALIWISISRNLNLSSFMFLTDGEDEDVNKDYIEETHIVAVKNANEKMVVVDAVPNCHLCFMLHFFF
jgi:hypothetical protein